MLAPAGRPLRERLWLGALGGVVHYGIALRWLTDFTGAGYPAVVALETALLVLVATVSLGGPTRPGAVTRRHGWPGWWLATPAALVLLEAVQNRFPFGGFPLPALGFSRVDGPFPGAAPVGGSLPGDRSRGVDRGRGGCLPRRIEPDPRDGCGQWGAGGRGATGGAGRLRGPPHRARSMR
ncbi:hypothetical protein LP422_14055 [Janibacter limosus]|uniref:Uncharacterized protein n=1 Tax=Janibacter limosus TaxID=53458 RepID=A0AC61U1G0_9MICO|nr:hypothetical protein [Janibacter limosus]UUZ43852.1 hypothetical protein LP422_14055 [Janibacter limosus]